MNNNENEKRTKEKSTQAIKMKNGKSVVEKEEEGKNFAARPKWTFRFKEQTTQYKIKNHKESKVERKNFLTSNLLKKKKN